MFNIAYIKLTILIFVTLTAGCHIGFGNGNDNVANTNDNDGNTTCSGIIVSEATKYYQVAVANPITRCGDMLIYRANSLQEAKICASNEGYIVGDQLCQYIFKVTGPNLCTTVDKLAMSSSDAIQCANSKICSNCVITDITSQVTQRSPGTCIGGLNLTALHNQCYW